MPTTLDLLESIEAFSLEDAATQAIEMNEQSILDINRAQLYDKGIGYDGKPLPPYTPQYERKKKRGVVDIYVSGSLHEKMKIVIEGSEYHIESEAPYSVYVERRRDKIFGFTDDGIEQGQQIVQPEVVEIFKEQTGTK